MEAEPSPARTEEILREPAPSPLLLMGDRSLRGPGEGEGMTGCVW